MMYIYIIAEAMVKNKYCYDAKKIWILKVFDLTVIASAQRVRGNLLRKGEIASFHSQ